MKKDKSTDKGTDKGAENAIDKLAGENLLKIKSLLKLNSEGKATHAQKEQLLKLMEQYWFSVRADDKDVQQPNLSVLDGPVVFKAFMEACWTEAFAKTEVEAGATGQVEPEAVQTATGMDGDHPELADQESLGVDWDSMYQRVVANGIMQEGNIDAHNADRFSGSISPTMVPLKERFIRPIWAAAAVVLIALGIGSWWILQRGKATQSLLVNQTRQDVSAPKGAKAVLVLADGRRVVLDSVSSGLVASEGNTSVTLNGKNNLNYTAKTTGTSGTLLYNELKVLKGSQPVAITLSDGTKVWLNVGSSLRYPTVFGTRTRDVALNGEAYFEVAHESIRPFVVQHGLLNVKVLGTHFNINSYQDEPALKVTLLEGAVDVEKQGQHLLLHPGQQAVTIQSANQPLKLNKQVDIDQVLSWKTSEFVFGDQSDFKAIMRQVARWYDVDIQYAGNVDTQFWGSISRTASLQQVLQLLEATGGVRFKLTGRQLSVLPVK